MKINKIKISLFLTLIIILIVKFNQNYLQERIGTIYSFLFLTMLVISIILFILTFQELKKYCLKLKKRTKLILLIIFLIGFLLRVFFMPHYHLFAVDDFWLMDQGKNFLWKGSPEVCNYNSLGEEKCEMIKSVGYPVVLSMSFFTFGINNYVALYFTSILATISLILFFFFVHIILKDENIALFSTVLLLFDKTNLYISSHVENINGGIFFLLASLIFFIIYFKKKDIKIHFLAIFLFLITIFIRIEYLLAGIIIFILYLLNCRKDIKKNHLIYPTTLGAITIIFYLLQIPVISKIGYNTLFSLTNLKENLIVQTLNLPHNYNFFLIALLILGLIYSFKEHTKKASLILTSLIVFSLFYFTWTQTNLYRVMMLVFLHLMIFISFGFKYLVVCLKEFKYFKTLIYFIMITLLINFSIDTIALKEEIKKEEILELNTLMPEIIEKQVSEDCFIILERPVFLTATTNLKVIPTIEIYSQPNKIKLLLNKSGCVVFYENSFCYEDLDEGPGRTAFQRNSTGRCKYFHKNYKLSEFFAYKKNNYTYRLYKILLNDN